MLSANVAVMTDVLLTADMLLNAYTNGLFPMAEHAGADAPIYLYRPDPRTLFTVADFHIPRRLQRWVSQTSLCVRETDVRTVMALCAEERDESWINPLLLDAYAQLSDQGFAKALGVYDQDRLVGGIYWVQIGLTVMAESMFSRVSNASKLALVSLMAALYVRGQRLGLQADQLWMDVQYTNPHLEQFHPTEISGELYQSALDSLLGLSAGFSATASSFLMSDFSASSLAEFLQFKTQIS